MTHHSRSVPNETLSTHLSMRDSLRVGLRSRSLTRAILGVGLASFGLAGVAYAAGVRLNLTGSIPRGVYRVTSGPVVRGATVLACLPSSIAAFARSRGYVPSGSCDDGSAPVGKTLAALPGDTVGVTDSGVYVNGRLLPNTAPLSRDSNGRPLPRLRIDRYVVPPGKAWLLSSYSPRSYDSRYYGAIDVTHITVRVQRLFPLR